MADINTIKQVPTAGLQYLDLNGLTTFWTKVKTYIADKATSVAVSHTEGTGNDYITLSTGTNATGGTVYTINDSNITTKFGKIAEELNTIKASAGVTKVTVVDTDAAGSTNYVSFTSDKTDGKGDIVLTVDESALDAKIVEIEKNITDLAGEGLADAEYQTITALSGAVEAVESAIANDVVTKVTVAEKPEGDTANYVSFTSNKADGKGEIVLTVDESGLDSKITAIEESIANGIAGLAGEGLADAEYQTITALSGAVDAAEGEIETAKGKIATIEGKIDALSSATHFRGVSEEKDTDGKPVLPSTAPEGLDYGDIIIVGNKEYIYNADPDAEGHTYNTANWVELGDTTAELEAITTNSNAISANRAEIVINRDAINSVIDWASSCKPIETSDIEALFV